MSCISPYVLSTPKGRFAVGCGKCWNCRNRRVTQWVFRFQQHMKRNDYAYFITLTYDVDSVPITSNGYMTLCKSDTQKFWKRLRKAKQCNIKYYLVGEYGSKGARPHYHAVVFSDVVISLEDFEKSWSKGHVHVGTVTSSSIAYTMKYIDKPFKKMHERDDRVPNFALMSKKIGEDWLLNTAAVSLLKNGRLWVGLPGGHKVAVPRYYLKKVFPSGVPLPYILKVQQHHDAVARANEVLARAKGIDISKKEMHYKNALFNKISNRNKL